jgi:hypothetical protein
MEESMAEQGGDENNSVKVEPMNEDEMLYGTSMNQGAFEQGPKEEDVYGGSTTP